ncbi:ketopantoate hydroxymethyltransferase [Desulfobulbus propionicus DSM 2032]|uniref:3-methyl-2-oxobutanoate hydroxymethyltransferase n=1 Tax=Desulfobulbus propionicus (strain ATCC 33891 / DSM 2032 / VKM B-1956 / 1pr3) TaxID=577650 RepID=A0A7U4DQL4_DESPD|nr:3-methyl-2-oxobutanoate hydroxymethyltransferase [Desulfobulbus propionicus]ADW19316.1 ketopantoate hydroxymethyltransferase [Desulfobulbus propionicus DSM 2032]
MHQKKLTIPDLRNRKNGTPIAEITAYDYPWAKAADAAGIDVVLVGDSLGMVVLGYPDTVSVTMEEMIHHTKAVVRGVERALVITDMPFGSYNSSIPAAINNATRILKEGRADAVKIEGGVTMAPTVAAIVNAGIPVQGHIGLTPQTATSLGGFKVQGKSAQAARQLLEDARALEEAGCFSIVLEAIPAPLAEHITREISIPTIGIGAGPGCDGQVLVIHDLVGMYDRFTPKFVKQYIKINGPVIEALAQYKAEVENRVFPTEAHSFSMKPEEMDKLLRLY